MGKFPKVFIIHLNMINIIFRTGSSATGSPSALPILMLWSKIKTIRDSGWVFQTCIFSKSAQYRKLDLPV